MVDDSLELCLAMREDDALHPTDDLDLDDPTLGAAPLAGLRRRAERYLDGDTDSPDADLGTATGLAGILQDPERLSAGGEDDELARTTVEATEIEEADRLDLARMAGGRDRALERDAFEEFVQLRRRHPPYTAEKLASMVEMAKGSDPESVALAEDLLIRHNVLWIVQCLQRRAGREVMSRSSEERNDLLAIGRWAFLVGIRKYDAVKAAKNGNGAKANLLTYTKYWITKLVNEYMHIERYGLKEEAALDRDKAVKARAALRSGLGREPSYDEVAQQLMTDARARLAKRGTASPSQEMLRRAGALGAERIKELLNHATSTVRLDTPVGGDADGPTVAEYTEDEREDPTSRLEAAEQFDAVMSRLNLLPDRRSRLAFRLLHGLPTEQGRSRLPVFNATEVGLVLGTGRDVVTRYEQDVRHALWGEVEIDGIERPWVRPGPSVPPSIREDVRRLIDLRAVVQSEGVRLTLPPAESPAPATGPSPFTTGGGGRLEVTGERWRCTATAQEGDVFDWLVARRGLTPSEALVEGMGLAASIPRGVRTLTVDRGRARRLNVHR